jgi:hypothetical protein
MYAKLRWFIFLLIALSLAEAIILAWRCQPLEAAFCAFTCCAAFFGDGARRRLRRRHGV